jgi:hypothetical protein
MGNAISATLLGETCTRERMEFLVFTKSDFITGETVTLPYFEGMTSYIVAASSKTGTITGASISGNTLTINCASRAVVHIAFGVV